jgi:hypothetical protein
MRLRRRLLGSTGLVVAAVAVVAGPGLVSPAGAAPGRAAPVGISYVRLAHLSPDTPAVDVYLTAFSRPDWHLVLRGVGYGQVSGYQRLQPDLYTVSMRLAGAAATSPAVLSATVQAGVNDAFTVAGLGQHAHLGLKVIADDLRLPAAGPARIRVIHAAASLGAVDISVDNSPAVIRNAGFAAVSSYANVPAGTHTLRVSSGDGSQSPATLSASLVPNNVYSLIVLDKSGGVILRTQVDAAGPGNTVPAGAVETGAGGTAPRPGSPAGLVLVIAGVLLAGAAALAWPRRSIGRHALAVAGR